MEYEVIIGLETHIQLNTSSKIFCSCKTNSWEAAPNTNICPVCTGMPGVLPVLNERVVEKGVLLATAMHSQAQPVSFFDRKNYFYPDLPKGYQISQYDRPLATGGYMDIPSGEGTRRVGIWKMHLEEDAGKTKNEMGLRLIDFNRCGVPLVEMVTAPDLRSADEAAAYLTRLRQLLRWIGISDADMEKGQLRCDANVSLRPLGATYLNPKTEIKNVNSIEAVRDAIEKEILRQTHEYEAGRKIESWTLEWDEDTQTLKKMRSKETEADYRYFREPDLLPVYLTDEWKAAILQDFPELPQERRVRFMREYALPAYDAEILTSERSLSDYFEAAVKAYAGDPKRVSNWLLNDVMRMLNESGQTAGQLALIPAYLAEIITLVDSGVVNASTGKTLLEKTSVTGKTPRQIVAAEGLAKVSDDSAIRAAAQQVIAENPGEAAAYRTGKTGLMGWFVGQLMRKMGGKADAPKARAIFEELLA
ncbi:MAG: Asp-tRNA(Asn)/Glu-tRNA(Gln) amidotransferase GatCAB subunit B [Anaerolineae bacterium CG_4_9_14_3_um_filter_57_17]|nr:Asp-tRNA(Asn)/Glu-tRNA(Gln) amidotransferase subunit GatB [bacterium]NCT20076.1 Asp-tRNA(Asn)/Glu-tRNA(Gln) amidotransferase subunit GatB [bacterium]OIO85461.1 MAG: glutaminyl-tRNA synthase (glutamine-hydrolyzing) subunit B [Anaerolineae bacterium CG2_30_57_67]PJB67093.1 MAG: Asp-tRNA(Asn)/Glu-tRNA(Gln) amidotransferase GatCAB subunit B [Anaerolineae bacterium CG_4_9_14_3_um_filter_57_17]